MRTKTQVRSSSSKLPLMKRFELNHAKQIRRLDELDREGDPPFFKSGLASQDAKYLALRREYEDLEREFDQQNLKRMTESSVAIYGGEEGKTVTSLGSLTRAKARKKAKPKSKHRFRL